MPGSIDVYVGSIPPSSPFTPDPTFVGPSFYAQFSNGPPSSASYFPLNIYEMNVNQWSEIPTRLNAAHIQGVDWAFAEPGQDNITTAFANGWKCWVAQAADNPATTYTNSSCIVARAMQDEPNSDGSDYAPGAGTPSNDVGATRYENDAHAQRVVDPTRPISGNLSKDVFDWSFPPSGWSDAQFEAHIRRQVGALDIGSADCYGWTDPFEWSQKTLTSFNGHSGAWIYGKTIDRLRFFNPNIPHHAFMELCCDGDSPPTNTMTPGMIETAIWIIIAHGGRGVSIWPRDFYHADDIPYSGATFTEPYSAFGDQMWAANVTRLTSVLADVLAQAPQLNSKTILGCSASATGIPVVTLGKDYGGKLWLLVMADGDETHPLSNTTSSTVTVTVPSVIAPGTVLNVRGESRTVTVNSSHQFTDTFATTTEVPHYSGVSLTYGYAHHIYEQP